MYFLSSGVKGHAVLCAQAEAYHPGLKCMSMYEYFGQRNVLQGYLVMWQDQQFYEMQTPSAPSYDQTYCTLYMVDTVVWG